MDVVILVLLNKQYFNAFHHLLASQTVCICVSQSVLPSKILYVCQSVSLTLKEVPNGYGSGHTDWTV